jgi:putative transposase
MSRRRRLNVPGTYYVVQVSIADHFLFATSSDYAHFERLLADSLARTHTRALLYCWLPHSIHLGLQIERAPLGRFMQRLTSAYAREAHRRLGARGHLFAQRYRAVLIDPGQWLLPLTQYLHFLPVTTGLVNTPEEYEFSSHGAYLGRDQAAWLDKRSVLEQLRVHEESYLERMAEPPCADDVKRLICGNPGDARVLADQAFLERLPREARQIRTRLSLEVLIEQVCRLLAVDRSLLLSRSRKRELALARAVIAWHATERGIATLADVSRRLVRDSSTLSIGMDRYRQRRPELFRLDAMRHVAPIGRGPS